MFLFPNWITWMFFDKVFIWWSPCRLWRYVTAAVYNVNITCNVLFTSRTLGFRIKYVKSTFYAAVRKVLASIKCSLLMTNAVVWTILQCEKQKSRNCVLKIALRKLMLSCRAIKRFVGYLNWHPCTTKKKWQNAWTSFFILTCRRLDVQRSMSGKQWCTMFWYRQMMQKLSAWL